MKSGKSALCLALAIVIVGCSKREDVQTVSWYREHAAERKAQVARCADDPGGLGKTANCTNALEAESIEGIGSFRKLPPLKLDDPRAETREDSGGAKVRP